MGEQAFQATTEDGARRVRLSGELDLASCQTAVDAIAPLAEGSGDILLDLSDLRFMDSSGIRVLLQAKDRLGERGAVVLLSPSPNIVRILQIAGIADLGIEIRDATS